MSYQVLARKWRPRNFQEMVGQEHVLRALVNALNNNRLHHAYLFTGTRGVGKTTIARIFAKSLNCETGVGANPCGQCGTCREIDEGRFVDLLEVDAASRTKVEDTRELMENVQYSPTRGRYKVYLIDEVHMLSNHSFNALLKTLEEPPPHVKFLLATTDPQRLPVTILSRCLQFNLKRMPVEMISGHLAQILVKEQLQGEPEALALIAKAADGSMRDALSLLDQGIAHSGGALRAADIRAMLGTIDRDYVFAVVDALAANDANLVLQSVQTISEQVPDFGQVLAELLSLFHKIAIVQTIPNADSALYEDDARIARYAQQIAAADIQLYYQIALLGRRDLPLAPDARTGLEMVLLRMLAFKPAGEGGAAPTTTPPPRSAAPRQAVSSPNAAAVVAAPAEGISLRPVPMATSWAEIVAALAIDGFVRQLAINCALLSHERGIVRLTLGVAHASLQNKKREESLAQALGAYFGTPVKVEITVGSAGGESETPALLQARDTRDRLTAAQQSIEEDGTIQALKETFNARVIPHSIRSTDEMSS